MHSKISLLKLYGCVQQVWSCLRSLRKPSKTESNRQNTIALEKEKLRLNEKMGTKWEFASQVEDQKSRDRLNKMAPSFSTMDEVVLLGLDGAYLKSDHQLQEFAKTPKGVRKTWNMEIGDSVDSAGISMPIHPKVENGHKNTPDSILE